MPSHPAVASGRLQLPFLPRSAAIGFAIAGLAVLMIAAFSYGALVASAATVQRVDRTILVIDRLQQLLSLLQDAETGQRGFMLTGDESYLEPYTNARAVLPARLTDAQPLIDESADQGRRLRDLAQFTTEKLDELNQTITLRRAGRADEALTLVRTDRGKRLMDGARQLVTDMIGVERAAYENRQRDADAATDRVTQITLGGSTLLLALIAAGAVTTSRTYRSRESEAWIRTSQSGLAEQIQGELRLEVLGDRALTFLARQLEAPVGKIFSVEPDGTFRRIGGFGLATAGEESLTPAESGLLGQVVKDKRAIRVTDVPRGHLPQVSSLGGSDPRELVILPANVHNRVYGVLELGLLRQTSSVELDLLNRVSEMLGIGLRSARDRSRLEELLEQTQQQSEELQAQQEELRVSNEELEEQSRALKESQARLEVQQAELEQTNTHLEEQAELLRGRTESLLHAQQALADKAADLERVNQYKSEFLANMSHELRTPLNSSLILAKLLSDNRDGNLTPEQVRFAQMISSAGHDLLALINDVLDLAKVEAGKIDITAEPVPVQQVLDGLVKTFEPVAADKGLTFRVEIDPGTGEHIETDATRLGQILKNLVSNAIKFTDSGEVSLRVSQQGTTIAWAVRDTGIGIEPKQQEVIFEAFRQADGSTHRRYGGTGLGLSISRDLSRLLGGDLAVASTPGEGSTFTLTLPVVYGGSAPASGLAVPTPSQVPAMPVRPAAAARRAAAIADDREQLQPSSRLVLIVEDDASFAAILRDLAHELGFQCVVAQTASEGLAAAASFRPSAILLDINLPDHSGLGVLDQLKRNPMTRHIPVHVASIADFAREAYELGAVGYALKPVKREDLVEAFKRLDAKVSQGLRRVLVVEDDERQRRSIGELLGGPDVEIIGVETARAALEQLRAVTFDCMVMDLSLPDLSGYELLETMARQDDLAFPPVIVYTGRTLSRDEEQRLRRFSPSIIIKDARSPERLLDEVTLFLHQVEASLPPERQRMLKAARDRDAALDGKRILVVEDDVRNIFALSSVLEPKGARVEIARNGREAIELLTRSQATPSLAVDLVLMDIMMPEMDGLTAMREIRRRAEWKKLPIIALTAKAMKDDQDRCLAAGANDYIAKPLDVEKLLSLVRVWMPR